MAGNFQVTGDNPTARFTLKLHRGDGMTLLAMNWKHGKPPRNFVGFAIEYHEPGETRFFPVWNRLRFPDASGNVDPHLAPSTEAPFQKFRWVHFPRNAELPGPFVYRVKPVFMDEADQLSFGEAQTAAITLARETYPGLLNVTFTRGFVSSQAFVERYQSTGPISKLLPGSAAAGLTFVPSHPQADAALRWMGFEARHALLEVLDQAIADPQAQVRVVAYDLSEPGVLARLLQLGSRLKIIIDDSPEHRHDGSAENQAATRLAESAGADHVKRQHVGKLQHNKTIVVRGPTAKAVVCGSTNLSWRGFFVQANNALVLRSPRAVDVFVTAFDNYWAHGTPAGFGATASATWTELGLPGIAAQVSFSPHLPANAALQAIAGDIDKSSTKSLFYSLAFLHQTPGLIQDAIRRLSQDDSVFVYGMSDRAVGGLELQKPNGNVSPVFPEELGSDVPEPFKSEPAGGGGIRLHHKFLVVNFDKPSARVYLGSYNFSEAADLQNGENLLLIRDRRVATSYMVEAIRLFDHYHFRVAQKEAAQAQRKLHLRRPPKTAEEQAWWAEYYADPHKIRDRKLFD